VDGSEVPAAKLDETALETVPCALCGRNEDRLLFRKGRFRIVRCSNCGLSYTNPRLRAGLLADLYTERYFRSDDSLVRGYADYLKEKAAIQRTFRRRWAVVKEFAELDKGSLLDVGCAMGFLLEIARDEGWDVAGLDISDYAVAFARQISALPVMQSDLRTLPFSDRCFHVITLWDVLEHVPDPVGLIRNCRRKLMTGGLLAIITPDEGSWPARLFGQKWVEYEKPDEHLFFFSGRTMRRLLEQEGFKLEWRGTAGKYVPVGFALQRLRSYQAWVFERIGNLVRTLGLDQRALRVNPFDKMFVLARKLPH
jgi:SAM-dependent methyltransferase